jgi:phosphoserine phosphatase
MLPSWNDVPSRAALVSFVARVCDPSSPAFVPQQERIAVFDMDGTLWVEQPMHPQAAFLVHRIRELLPRHPDWRTRFKALLDGDVRALSPLGEQGALAVVAATHTGMTSDEFTDAVEHWLESSLHPTLRRPYTALVYQPMLELLTYLRTNGFTLFIVSGGGVDFIRPWAQRVFGIPPHHVIGSRVKYRYVEQALLRLPEVDLVDDHAGKPVGIQQGIGQCPILAVGNSDGDYQMLEWVTSGRGLGMLIHHTDAARELAYGRDAATGRLSRALDDAPAHGWIVVDMKRDWSTVFPP